MIIMTSNVWGYYFGNTVEGRDRGLADVFGKYGPDVLGLQEMTPSFYGSELTGRLREGYRILGAPGNCTPLAFRRSFSLADWGFEQLRDTPDRDKSVTWAVLNDPETGKTFGACSTHFWWPEDEEAERIRLKNAERIAQQLRHLQRGLCHRH